MEEDSAESDGPDESVFAPTKVAKPRLPSKKPRSARSVVSRRRKRVAAVVVWSLDTEHTVSECLIEIDMIFIAY